MTDGSPVYTRVGREFNGHGTVNYSASEYVTTGGFKHNNTVENLFSIFKRSMIGTNHHMSEAHLTHYCAEFDFCYNTPKNNDAVRADAALERAAGKRLTIGGLTQPKTLQQQAAAFLSWRKKHRPSH